MFFKRDRNEDENQADNKEYIIVEDRNKDTNEEKNKKTKKMKYGTFDGILELSKMLFKKRDYKIEKREITKEDKKAILITIAIILGVGLLLWFLPFTHQFFEDIIFLRR